MCRVNTRKDYAPHLASGGTAIIDQLEAAAQGCHSR